MAAAVEAAHVRSAEGGRADERERASKARRRLPAAPVAVAASSRRTQRTPGHPTPILTRFTPTLRKGRGKRRGTSLLASGTRRLPQSSAATALVRGGSSSSRQRAHSRESLPPPTSGLHSARARIRPLPGARTALPRSAAEITEVTTHLEPSCHVMRISTNMKRPHIKRTKALQYTAPAELPGASQGQLPSKLKPPDGCIPTQAHVEHNHPINPHDFFKKKYFY
ncbi:uncharacterized protein LOC102435806 isoform X1 [Myotis lucifugus]|uniref:uncharacterized protein LOC102435806 isoform X1 n=1 Tax=Myotis lucifugus TaxID=59463 RepID=UPI000CCBDE73|nr:uncharacterized protein LOC102435806 isoform X1 [Myotis lucifugus]